MLCRHTSSQAPRGTFPRLRVLRALRGERISPTPLRTSAPPRTCGDEHTPLPCRNERSGFLTAEDAEDTERGTAHPTLRRLDDLRSAGQAAASVIPIARPPPAPVMSTRIVIVHNIIVELLAPTYQSPCAAEASVNSVNSALRPRLSVPTSIRHTSFSCCSLRVPTTKLTMSSHCLPCFRSRRPRSCLVTSLAAPCPAMLSRDVHPSHSRPLRFHRFSRHVPPPKGGFLGAQDVHRKQEQRLGSH
jgi:hypothetical protein